MSDWFSLRQNQNDTCNCCNQGRSFGFADGLRNGFTMPGGIFSYTTYGMINGDYSFYNPVPSLDMFTYFPGMNTFNSPCGLNFDSNLFTNLLGVTAMQMNQQNFWNGINGGINGGNNIFGGMNFNTPFNFGFNGVNGNNGNNGGTPQTEEEKAAKKKYDTMKAFLNKYAVYQDSKDLKDEIKEIDKLKITEHDEETDKDKTRNATYEEKLAKLQTLLDYIKTNRATQLEKFITSENSGLLTKNDSGDATKNKPGALTKGLEIIGYERKTALAGHTAQTKAKLTNITNTHGANITEAFGWFENYEILDSVSSYNTNNGSNLMSDVMIAYKATQNKPEDQALVKAGAIKLAEKLVTRADTTEDYLNEEGKKEFAELKKALNGKITSDVFDDDFCEAFNKLYAAMRIIEVKHLLSDLKGHYEKAVPGVFDFIVTKTEEDLKAEKMDETVISNAKTWALDEGSEVPTSSETCNANGIGNASNTVNTSTPEEVSTQLSELADSNTIVKKVEKEGNLPVYVITDAAGKERKFLKCPNSNVIMEFGPGSDNGERKYTITEFKDLVKQAEKSYNIETLSCLKEDAITMNGHKVYHAQGDTTQYVKLEDGYHKVLSDSKIESKATKPEVIQRKYDEKLVEERRTRLGELFTGEDWVHHITNEYWQEINAILGVKEYGDQLEEGKVKGGVTSVINDKNILVFLSKPIVIKNEWGIKRDKGLFELIHDRKCGNTARDQLINQLIEKINNNIDAIIEKTPNITDKQKLVLIGYKNKLETYMNPKEFDEDKGKEIDSKIGKLIAYLEFFNLGGFSREGYAFKKWEELSDEMKKYYTNP